MPPLTSPFMSILSILLLPEAVPPFLNQELIIPPSRTPVCPTSIFSIVVLLKLIMLALEGPAPMLPLIIMSLIFAARV